MFRWVVTLGNRKPRQAGAIWLKTGWGEPLRRLGRSVSGVQSKYRSSEWAQTSKFQELREASRAGGDEQTRPAAKLSASINGRAVCANHTVLFRPFYIDLGFYSE